MPVVVGLIGNYLAERWLSSARSTTFEFQHYVEGGGHQTTKIKYRGKAADLERVVDLVRHLEQAELRGSDVAPTAVPLLDWTQPGANELLGVLVVAYPGEVATTRLLARVSNGLATSVRLEDPPRDRWWRILEHAVRQDVLDRLVAVVLADDEAAAYHVHVQSAADRVLGNGGARGDWEEGHED